MESLEPRRLLAGAHLDSSFGGGGGLRIDARFGHTADEVAVGPDGSIYTAGESSQGWSIAKFRRNGAPDPSFGAGGIVVPALVRSRARSILVQPDGKVLVGGGVDANRFAVQRYTAAGELDTSWGLGGTFSGTFATPGKATLLRAMALLPDGRLVLTGANGFYDDDVHLMRLTTSGEPDPSFGTGGVLRMRPAEVGTFEVAASDVAVDAEGRLVMTVNVDPPDTYEFFSSVVRLMPDGTLDTSFGGGDGTTLIEPNGTLLNAIALAPDGKIVVAGQHNTSAAWRLNTDGSFDESFGSGGVTGVAGRYIEGTGVAVGPDGSVVLCGLERVEVGFAERTSVFTIAGFLSDGRLDAQFARGGVFQASSKQTSHAYDLAFDPVHSVAVASGAVFTDTGGSKIALARVTFPRSPAPVPSPDGPFSTAMIAAVTSTLPSELVIGSRTKGTAQIGFLNAGSSAIAGGVTARLYASKDGGVDGSDVALMSTTAGIKLAAGKEKTLRLRLPPSLGLPAGTYQILAQVEYSDGRVVVVSAPTAFQAVEPFSDIKYGPATAAGTVPLKPGSRFKVTFTAENVGNVRSAGDEPRVSVFAAGRETGRSVGGSWGVIPFRKKLNPGQRVTLAMTATVPETVPPGEYELFVFASEGGSTITVI